MFGMGRGQGQPATHPSHIGDNYSQHSSVPCVSDESKLLPSLQSSSGHTGHTGDQVSTETPPQTPPNGVKLTSSSNRATSGDQSYHAHVQQQSLTPSQAHNPYPSQYPSSDCSNLYDDKNMVQYPTNDSINNIYNIANSRT